MLLHPACATNPAAVRAVQEATGQLILINGGKPHLSPSRTIHLFVSGHADAFRDDIKPRRFAALTARNSDPFGGDAA